MIDHDRVVEAIYTYGFYTALQILKEEEQNDNFEECAIIKGAMDQVAKGREWYLSTETTDENMERIRDATIIDCKYQDNREDMMHYFKSQFWEMISL